MQDDNEMFLSSPLSVGDVIPEEVAFQVYHKDEIKDVTIGSYRKKWLVLFFYPADFTFVCPTELEEMANQYDEFVKAGAEIVSVSADTVFVHKAWHNESEAIRKIRFPMAADPTHTLADLFEVMVVGEGVPYRTSVIVDPEGKIRGIEINDNSIGRNAKELLRKVKAARYVSENPGNVCPAGWNDAGDKTLKPGLDLVGKL